jgi:predicted nucleotidyltransferase
LSEKESTQPRTVLFLTVIGSHIWKMNTETSDHDLMQCYVASTREFLMQTADTHSKHYIDENSNDDYAIHEIGQIIEQLLKGNINFLIGVMSPIVEYSTPFFNELRYLTASTISKNCYNSIHGLGLGNFAKYINSGVDPSQKRINTICRLLTFGCIVLHTGEFKFEPFWTGTAELIPQLLDQLDIARDESPLPDRPPEEPFRDLLYRIREAEWLGEIK